ncbi:VWA domain-containing protein [Seongchinamella sediminis]|uniref:VWA domain-containing protein n=1 Tax=Seongchinamella sediminis TaxID=2283635 RepID=A0A3L7E208_9GAMM|nr:vWA domain-containing protein [Seongchinamella sediminis]RLQ22925.1 VWA domain-containing protein [Seongchinamella sediminis]
MSLAARTCLAFALLASVLLSPVLAEPGPVSDLRLLVDVSANMQRLDPENRRSRALQMMVRLLPAGSRASIWVFDDTVRALVPAGSVDEQWREQAIGALAGLEQGGERSNIPAALAAATADLDGLGPGYSSSVLLLTAGGVNVADSPMVNVSAARKLLGELAVELGDKGVPVHTIALSREADSQLLRSLAQQTGGTSVQAEDATEWGSIFLNTLEMVMPATRLPVFGREFSIDPGVTGFVVLAQRPRMVGKLQLLAPDGTLFSAGDNPGDIHWFRNEHISMARVTSPAAGSWRLRYPDKSTARVYVDSDIELRVGPLPHFITAGEEALVSLTLVADGTRVTDPQVLARYAVFLELTTPGGETERYRPGAADGDGLLTVGTGPLNDPGRYRLLARLEGDGIAREIPVYVTVNMAAQQPTLVTRGEALLEDDFKAPLFWLTGIVTSILVLVWYLLRRRKQRKLALWQKRARDLGKSGKHDFLSADPAQSGEPPGQGTGSLD